jgi:hypothetical protein
MNMKKTSNVETVLQKVMTIEGCVQRTNRFMYSFRVFWDQTEEGVRGFENGSLQNEVEQKNQG